MYVLIEFEIKEINEGWSWFGGLKNGELFQMY